MAWRVANVASRPPVFDRDILALDVAGLAQAIAEHRREISVNIRVARMEKSNYGHRRLLRARRERAVLTARTRRGRGAHAGHRLQTERRLAHDPA